jgi:thiol-disulfide isomerase/thioredoxin
MWPERMANPFYSTFDIREIAGKPFITNQEFLDWRKEISPDQESKVMAAWNSWKESIFATSRPNELIRFRDYREVAPGVWIPFREDRVWTHGVRNGGGRKYIRLWVAVQEVRTDIDLAETIQKLQPQENEQIQDQRFGVPVNYKYRRDRTQAELLEMVDTERQKFASNAAMIKQILAPLDELIGKQAPVLPAEGWIGGEMPKPDGKPYLVHFWATWCGPCKNDLPLLKKLAADGVRVIGMHPAGTPVEDVAKVIHDQELRYPTFLASSKTGDADRQIGGYPTGMFPYCILVDSQGRVTGHGSLGPELLAKLRALTPGKEKADQK